MDKQICASLWIHLSEQTWWKINKTSNNCYSIDHTGYVRTDQDNSMAPNCRQTITITNAKSTLQLYEGCKKNAISEVIYLEAYT